MAGVTVSTKRNRVYPHKFDHDEAQRMRSEGLTYSAIARELGVSVPAIEYVCKEHVRVRRLAQSREWQRGGACPECGRPSTRTSISIVNTCRECSARLLSERLTTTARPAALLCSNCGQWLPDDQFTIQRKRKGRRLRASECKPCAADRRRAERARKRVAA